MGAAGITCSSCEMSAAGEHGMDLWLDKVPTRQDNMQSWEILLSESQERMLVVVQKGSEKEVEAIFEKWDLNCAEIGVVTEGGQVRYFMDDELVAEVPAEHLVLGGGAPQYEREYKEPEYYQEYKKFDINKVKEPRDLVKVAKKLMASPNIASKKWIYEQYDSMVGTVNMSTNGPTDAGLVNIKDTDRALAFTVDCNSRYVHADPEVGTAIAVSEAARNIVCSGGEPSAITNCLNFGNPYNPEAYWQFVGAIKGMSAACSKFQTPVTGGNVSFYNQSVIGDETVPVFPTPTIGMMGIVQDKKNITPLGFQKKGDLIYLIGDPKEDIASSEYLVQHHGIKESPAPAFDLDEEYTMQEALKKLIKAGTVNSAHDVSEGGLFIALAEASFVNDLGFDVLTDSEIREDAYLFGESQSRVVVSVDPDEEDSFITILMDAKIRFTLLGHVTQGKFVVDDKHFGMVDEYKELHSESLGRALAH